jgi:hypothetical protein
MKWETQETENQNFAQTIFKYAQSANKQQQQQNLPPTSSAWKIDQIR